jgi:catechol 2,3-dioxygenase
MTAVARPMPTHFGIYVTDLPKMVSFYRDLFGLTITDQGEGKTFRNTIVFTSGTPHQHHQLVLASGRPPGTPSTVMQIAFMVPSIDSLRELTAKAGVLGATDIKPLNHGNALSVYFKDPEGNTVEIYLDTPWYIAQPFGEPLDLTQSDEQIMRETEALCRQHPTFKPVADWQQEFVAR